MKDHTVRFLAKFLQFKSRQALAGQWDKFHGLTTVEETLDLYGRLWDQVGRLGFDRRDILAPEEVEEHIERALVADLLEDIDLSGLAA